MVNLEHNWLRPKTGKISQKSILLILGALLTVIWFLIPHKAGAYGYNWEISSFNAHITVQEDASLLVKETIVADFTNEAHHGIFRTIPIKYQDALNQNLNLRVTNIKVTNENGTPWWTDISTEGEYLKIQTGDPDRYLQEPSTFIIEYTVERAISFQFDDHDEIYWNATGDEWPVPIRKATATITLPASIPADSIRATCYTGAFGSTQQTCTATVQTAANTITYTTQAPLNPQEGLTIVTGLAKNYITEPSLLQKTQWFLADNWGYLIPFLALGLMYYRWHTTGRDPKTNRDTIVPLYKAPKNLTPGEAGTLIDEEVDMRDISATIIDLAVRGYLKIHETEKKGFLSSSKEYEFIRLLPSAKEAPDQKNKETPFAPHEAKIFTAIFGNGTTRKLEDLNNKFYAHLPTIKDMLYKELITKKYFTQSPQNVRTHYQILAGILIAVPIFSIGYALQLGLVSMAVGIGLSGVIILIFSKYMPAKTRAGTEAYYQILGLEEFIKTAEKDRIKFQEDQNIFMELLPYAMAFNLADKWSNAFKDIMKTAPSWYTSSNSDFATNFNTFYLYNALNNLSHNMNTTLTSSPRSSSSGGSWSGGSGFSGGFSGGGFGGGGGGSW